MVIVHRHTCYYYFIDPYDSKAIKLTPYSLESRVGSKLKEGRLGHYVKTTTGESFWLAKPYSLKYAKMLHLIGSLD